MIPLTAIIEKCILRGSTFAPTSKSMAHRLLICAALSDGVSVINNVTFSDDINATIECLKNLGAKFNINGNAIEIIGSENIILKDEKNFNCNESGSTLRFILPLLLLSDVRQNLICKGRLLKRPIDVYEEICHKQNLFIEKSDKITVMGKIKAGEYHVKGNISSQFITGLLLALSKLKEDSTIIIEPPLESRSYIDMTLYAMKTFGISVDWTDDFVIYIKGGQKYIPAETEVEGDYSGAAFLEAFNYIDGNIKIYGLNPDSVQGDMIYKKYFQMIENGNCNLDVTDCPDLAPILMTLAAIKNGAVLTGTRRLKLKESDRGVVMARELAKFGADVVVNDNTITIRKSALHTPSETLFGHNDHRIVMSLAVICSIYGGKITEAESVSKSFPDFFEKISMLGGRLILNDN